MARSSAGLSSLARAVAILDTFDTGIRDQSASEIAMRASMPLTSAHRLLLELVTLGLVERTPDKRYRVGLRLWELAVRTPGALGIREIAMPYLRSAHSAIGQHLQLGVLQDDEVLYLERLSAPKASINFVTVGGRMPYYVVSSGLVLVAGADDETRTRLVHRQRPRHANEPSRTDAVLSAELDGIRHQGYAITRGYVHPAATAIAVPVISSGGTALAAISAIVPADNTHEAHVLAVLRPVARVISDALLQQYEGGRR